MSLRQPIVVVLGHVDHGKTSLLDKIRGTSVAAREPGAITQWIGASLLPADVLKKICGPLLERFRFEIKVPGLLFIDTPGHETFSNLRRRGGSAADIAILVIDITKGIEPQTTESIGILRARKTPFVIAANKIDLVPGWRHARKDSFLESIQMQPPEVRIELDNRLYTIMGTLSRLGFRSDRFDKITDFKTNLSIVPTSARTGEGMPELMAVLVGLTQAYLTEELLTTAGPSKGTVLEVKEEPGLGITINAIVYDGILKVDDTIVIGGREKPIVTSVRALLLPKPLDEIRDPRDRFTTVPEVRAASGVKVAAPNLSQALSGSSLYTVPPGAEIENYVDLVNEEVEKLRINTDRVGVVLKTDTLGSLEAITTSLMNAGIPVRFADVGDVSRREVVEAEIVKQKDRLLGVVLGFNVKMLSEAEEEAKKADVPVFQADIIYHLIEDYSRWVDKERAAGIKAELDRLIRPGKIKILPGCIFRRSKPAIVGVEVVAGRIRPRYPLILEDGRQVGEIQRIQDKGKDIGEASLGMQVAISIEKAIVGRHISEGNVLIISVPEKDVKVLQTKFKEQMSPDEIELLNVLTQVMRKENPLWAM